MSRDKAIVAYTCITKNYDERCLHQTTELGIDYVCFTDFASTAGDCWQPRSFVSPPRLTSGHDINRFHKIFCHHVLSDYRYSVYMDGNISFNGQLKDLVDAVSSRGAALGLFCHPAGRNLQQEVTACKEKGKFDRHDMDHCGRQLAAYCDQGLDIEKTISANYLLVRDHSHPQLADCMSLWWSQLFEFTKRDQLSLAYALQKSQLPWVYLDQDLGIDASLLIRRNHRADKKIQKKRKDKKYLRKLLNFGK